MFIIISKLQNTSYTSKIVNDFCFEYDAFSDYHFLATVTSQH